MNSIIMIGILSCIALIAAVNAMAMDKDLKFKGLMSDIVQKPLFYHEEMRNINIQSTFNGTDRDLGDPCQFSFDCHSGCCLQEKNGKRRCARKGKKDERCSVSQVKLDLFVDYCPCEKGNKYCSADPEARCAA